MKNLIYCDSFMKKRKEGNVMALTLRSKLSCIPSQYALPQPDKVLDG